MSGTPGTPPRRFTPDQKVSLVTEIARQHRAGLGTLREIAMRLGTTDTCYANWIREGIAPLPPARRRHPYTPEERAERVGKVDRLLADGRSLIGACREAGISDESYKRWRRMAAPLPTMRPAEITVQPAVTTSPGGLTLVAPGGYRVEGLDVPLVAALLRTLA